MIFGLLVQKKTTLPNILNRTNTPSLGPMTMSVFMTGVMTGAVALDPLSDKLGRKRTMLVTWMAMLLANTWSGMAPNFKVNLTQDW